MSALMRLQEEVLILGIPILIILFLIGKSIIEKIKIDAYLAAKKIALKDLEYISEQKKSQALVELRKEHAAIHEKIENREKILEKKKKELEQKENELKEIKILQDKIFEEKTSGFPYVSQLYSFYCERIGILYSEYLSHKKNPAFTTSEIVKELTKRLKEVERLYFKTKGILDYYEHSFPWLKDTLGISDENIGEYPPSLQATINNEWKTIRIKYKDIQEKKEQADVYAKEVRTQADAYAKRVKEQSDIIERKTNKIAEAQEKLFTEKTNGFPWIASRYAIFKNAEIEATETYLRTKKQPAIKAADVLKEYGKRLREAEKNAFICKGILEYYESLFPWLIDFRDAPDDVITQAGVEDTSNDDPASKLLSRSEWSNLSKTEKFQKALDRYQARHKTNWEIGRDFERFVGYEYECEGWDVTFYGAIQGFEDMGRDLIVKKNNSIKIIQCKYWAKEKIIHEKHIFQLFGTCVSYSLNNGIINQKQTLQQQSVVDGVFIASCSLSETAKMVASILGIKVIEFKKLEKYPCVKCNIGKNGEKIYHLPFDQNYDKIKIEPNKGEFYCKTIREAEDAGFRRAYKWRGNKS